MKFLYLNKRVFVMLSSIMIMSVGKRELGALFYFSLVCDLCSVLICLFCLQVSLVRTNKKKICVFRVILPFLIFLVKSSNLKKKCR